MIWLSLATFAMASPPCPNDTVFAIETSIAAVDSAYKLVDETAFDRSVKSLNFAIACIDEMLPPGTLSRLHRSVALASFVSGQVKASRRSLASARLVDPTWMPDPKVFPDEHPYRLLWNQASDPGPVAPIGDISPDIWIVDGVARIDAPTGRGFLLQVESDGKIVWAGYLWDFDEIPDRGQHDAQDPSATPRTFDLHVGALARYLNSVQEAESGASWRDQQASAAGGGLAFAGRYTPVSFAGGEIRIESVSSDDPVSGGGLGTEVQIAGLLGTAVLLADAQIFTSARLGAARSLLRSWPNGVDGSRPAADLVISAALGAEVGVRNDAYEVRLSSDLLLASVTVPYRWQIDGIGAFGVTDQLAVQVGAGARGSALKFVDGDQQTIGSRRDLDIRMQLGVSVWL